jgi:hypothetical protein
MTVPTGFSVSGSPITSSGTLAVTFASGYALPTTVKQSNWDDAYTFVSNFPSQTGNNGKFLYTSGSVLSWQPALQNPMTAIGDMIYGGVSGAVTVLTGNQSAVRQYLQQVGTGSASAAPTWGGIVSTDISGQALTKTDDTNVTLTLTGTPGNSVLNAVGLTLGWSGTLTAARGGTGTGGVTGIMLGNSTAPVTGVAGIGGQLLRIHPLTNQYEFWTPTYLESPMTTAGDLITANAAAAPIRLPANQTTDNLYLRSVSGTVSYTSIQGSHIVGAGITSTNDTNVQISLGGTPANSVLRSVSLTMGWAGTLAVSRGGSGAATLTGVLIGNGTSAFTGVTGTALQLLRRNSTDTAYEFWTPTYMNNPFTTAGDIVYSNSAGAPIRLGGNTTTTRKFLSQTGDGTNVTNISWQQITASDISGAVTGSGTTSYLPKWTSSTALGNSQIYDNGTNVGIGVIPTHKLDVGGNIGINGGIALASSGNYHVLYDKNAVPGLYIGNSTSPENIYANTTHNFTNKNGSTTYATFASGLMTFEGTLTAGNTSSPNGSIILQDNYSVGHLSNIGSMYSTGGLMLGYSVTPSTSSATSFVSATGLSNWFRSSIVLGENISIYTGAAQTVSIGSSVTMSERLRLFNSGQLRLLNYTSASSFTGLTVGFLGFTSTGVITTNAIPGGVNGTQNYLAKFDSTGLAVTDSRFVDNGTNFLLNGATSYVTGFNLIGDLAIQSTSTNASSFVMRSNNTPTSGLAIAFIDGYAITTGSTYQRAGGIELRASQNWNSTSAGTNIWVQTTPDNTTNPADMFVFLNNGAVRFIGRGTNPIGATAGTMYYNSTSNQMRYYNGTSWISF